MPHGIGIKPKQENVVRANRVADFNIGAVFSAYRQRAIQREFHIAGARGFGSCR